MGDPKKSRKKYSTPIHPWIKSRIDEEKVFTKEYGFKNKKEIWKMTSFLSKLKKQAKKIIALQDKEKAMAEERKLIDKLKSYNLVKEGAKIDNVLAIQSKDILERRLQTIIFKRNLAKNAKQARQMITHRHIMVNGKVIDSPSYLVSIEEEPTITYAPKSGFSDSNHPEILKLRESVEKVEKELEEATKLKNKSEEGLKEEEILSEKDKEVEV